MKQSRLTLVCAKTKLQGGKIHKLQDSSLYAKLNDPSVSSRFIYRSLRKSSYLIQEIQQVYFAEYRKSTSFKGKYFFHEHIHVVVDLCWLVFCTKDRLFFSNLIFLSPLGVE